jgi:hypothetical protein
LLPSFLVAWEDLLVVTTTRNSLSPTSGACKKKCVCLISALRLRVIETVRLGHQIAKFRLLAGKQSLWICSGKDHRYINGAQDLLNGIDP